MVAQQLLFLPCEKTTSENYLHALPMLLARRYRLIDSSTYRSQLISLERYMLPAISKPIMVICIWTAP